MKNLIVGSLIALAASQAAGCVITSGDDTVEEDAFITASWNIKHLAPDMNISCPPGYDTAALVSKSLDGAPCDPILGGSDTCIELFDCAAGSGVSAPLVPNVYQSWIQIQDHSGGQVYAKSTAATVDVIASDKSFSAEILENGGYFQFGWTLNDAATGDLLTCDQAASTGVESISSVVTDPDNMKTDIFDCDAPYGITSGLMAADYTVSIQALGAGDGAIGDAVTVNRATIGDRNQVTDLGDFMLPVD